MDKCRIKGLEKIEQGKESAMVSGKPIRNSRYLAKSKKKMADDLLNFAAAAAKKYTGLKGRKEAEKAVAAGGARGTRRVRRTLSSVRSTRSPVFPEVSHARLRQAREVTITCSIPAGARFATDLT